MSIKSLLTRLFHTKNNDTINRDASRKTLERTNAENKGESGNQGSKESSIEGKSSKCSERLEHSNTDQANVRNSIEGKHIQVPCAEPIKRRWFTKPFYKRQAKKEVIFSKNFLPSFFKFSIFFVILQVIGNIIGEILPKYTLFTKYGDGYYNPRYEYVPMLNIHNPFPTFHIFLAIAFIIIFIIIYRKLSVIQRFNNTGSI